MANPARDPNTPEDVTLGEVHRTLKDVAAQVNDVDGKVDELTKRGLPRRVENLETWRDRALLGLATAALAGGALFGTTF